MHRGKRQLEEEQHACMGGRPNVGRVRVFVIFSKKVEELEMCKYTYVGIIWRLAFFLLGSLFS